MLGDRRHSGTRSPADARPRSRRDRPIPRFRSYRRPHPRRMPGRVSRVPVNRSCAGPSSSSLPPCARPARSPGSCLSPSEPDDREDECLTTVDGWNFHIDDPEGVAGGRVVLDDDTTRWIGAGVASRRIADGPLDLLFGHAALAHPDPGVWVVADCRVPVPPTHRSTPPKSGLRRRIHSTHYASSYEDATVSSLFRNLESTQ